jgi:hypothetical protein
LQQAAYSAYSGYGSSYTNPQVATSAPQSAAYGTYPTTYPAQVPSIVCHLFVVVQIFPVLFFCKLLNDHFLELSYSLTISFVILHWNCFYFWSEFSFFLLFVCPFFSFLLMVSLLGTLELLYGISKILYSRENMQSTVCQENTHGN